MLLVSFGAVAAATPLVTARERGTPMTHHVKVFGRRLGPLALALALGACTGVVGDGDDEPGPGDEPGTPGAGGGAGSRGTPPGPPPVTVTPPPTAACRANQDPGPSPLLKLSTVQYRNTVRDLLTASGAAMVAEEVKPLLGSVPPDVDPLFAALDNDVGPDHVLAFFKVASAAASGITGRPERLAAVAGACAGTAPLSARCVDDFLASFGRRAFRRPLTAEEATALRTLNDGKSPPAEVFRSLILTLLTSPRFLNHLEIEGTPIGGREDYLQLTPWEIASRLSYTFWQTMPDEALFAAAADGSIATEAGFQRQLDRVMADPRTKETVWQFWSQWLRLDGYFFGFDTTRPAFRALVAGEMINERGRDHYGDMVREIRELTELVAFGRKGTLADLLTTDVSVTKSADLARLYQVPPWDGRSEYPRLPAGTRAGLLTRSALLVVGEEQTNPFHRGAIIRKRLLCDPLASPDPNSLPPGSLDAPPADPMMTTRQRFEGKMLPECRGCHGMFNDIGYVLEAYDSLGRHRTAEKVFDRTGKIVGELPIDATGVPRVDLADMRTVKGPLELTARVVESKKFEPCFAKSYFTYALRRETAEGSADACAVDDLVAELARPGVSLGDAYRRIALQASFRRRKVGAR